MHMQLNFEPIDLNRQEAYQKKLAQCGQIASDYSFINIWGWGPEYGLQWAWHDDLVCIKQTAIGAARIGRPSWNRQRIAAPN
jgi:hypothetical protein